MDLEITNNQKKYPLDTEQIRHWACSILWAQRENHVAVGLVFVNDRIIRRFNRQYRGVDAATDVLAFPMDPVLLAGSPPRRDLRARCGGSAPRNLGDVMISLERADKEAHLFGHRYSEHLFFLLIHGLLHLFGYDHERSRSEAIAMRRREKVLFKRFYKDE